MLRKAARKGGFSVVGRTCDYPPIEQSTGLFSRSSLRSIAEGARDYPPIEQSTGLFSRSSLRSIAEGAPSNHQRILVEAIKRARNIALLPFASD